MKFDVCGGQTVNGVTSVVERNNCVFVYTTVLQISFILKQLTINVLAKEFLKIEVGLL